MKIIVTGGAGFLGKHLCRALDQSGHEIKVIDLKENPEFPTVIADVRDSAKMLEEIKDAEAIFHLASLIEAGESVQQPARYTDYNVMGTIAILEAMRQNDLKTLIFSSSAAIYGEPLQVPIKEDDRTIPINPYGMTKLAMEGLLSSYCQAYDFTGVALRYFNLYGPEEHHQPETHAIPRFIKQVHEGSEVTVWGNGEHQRDYVYIDDVVAAHLQALEYACREENQAKYHYFNLSTERAASVLDIVRIVSDVVGKEAKVKHFPERPGDPLVLVADAGKAREQLSWQAEMQLEDGLRKTAEYFLKLWE